MWRISDNVARVEQRLALAVTAFSTAIFTFLLCEGKPWLLFAKAGSTDFYDVQARSWKGKLDVPPEIVKLKDLLLRDNHLYYGPTLAILRFPQLFLVRGLTVVLHVLQCYRICAFMHYHVSNSTYYSPYWNDP